MEKRKEDKVKAGGVVKDPKDEITIVSPINERNSKWAIKINHMSESKSHLLSISNENLKSLEVDSSDVSIPQKDSHCDMAHDLTSSNSSTSIEQKMHKRKVEKEDASSDIKDASPSAANFINEACTDISADSPNAEIPDSIFGTVVEEDGGNKEHPRKELSIKVALLLLLLIFAVCLGALAFVYSSFPKMNKKESKALKFPSNIDDAKLLGQGKKGFS